MKICTVSVINDLSTDQRVRKTCLYLVDKGFNVSLVGRILPTSPDLIPMPYQQKRMKLFFKKGPLFYAFFNLRLFFFLLFKKSDLLISNDLDTLLPNFLVSKIKGIHLVYDSHEYFTEVPELKGRFARKIWLLMEHWIFPKLKNVFTVNDSIANEYEKIYNIKPLVVRNLPEYVGNISSAKPSDFNIPSDKKIVILQGSGINMDRGGEEAVLAMKKVDNAILLIVGSGDMLLALKEMVKTEKLEEKVLFIPRQSPDNLRKITALASVGLSIDKDTNLNYRYSLPNKVFDYIQCGVPVLASNLPEVRKIVEDFSIGRIMENYSVDSLASLINLMILSDDREMLKTHLEQASKELIWQQNIPVLDSVYNQFI